MTTVDAPESPDFSPDGTLVAFSAMQGGVTDIFVVDIESRAITNITKDAWPTTRRPGRPTASAIVYLTRVSGNEKLFRVEVADGKRTQLTFGTHDEAAPSSSTTTPWSSPRPPSIPTRRSIPRWPRTATSTTSGRSTSRPASSRRYTDARRRQPLAGRAQGRQRRRAAVAFVSYYKGEYGMHVLDRDDPIGTAATEDFGAPGPMVDFQAPLTHPMVDANMKRKGRFEKLYLEGRPPVNVGLTSGGDFLGGTAIAFTDVLGDQQFTFFAASVSQYRSFSGSYLNLERRFQYALQGFSQTQFFYGQLRTCSTTRRSRHRRPRPGHGDADLARRHGVRHLAVQPLPSLELSGGIVNYEESFEDPGLEDYSQEYQQEQFGRTLFNNGTMVPMGIAFVQETTLFREFGPLAGNTVRLSYEVAPRIGTSCRGRRSTSTRASTSASAASGLLALRARGFKSWGDNPGYFYFGGNSEMRGYEYLSFVGQNAVLVNAELRSRSSTRWPRRSASSAASAARSSPTSAAPSATGPPFNWWTNDTVDRAADRRLRERPEQPRHGLPVYGNPVDVTGSAWWTRAPATASACRPSPSASRSTSTGLADAAGPRTRKTSSSHRWAAARIPQGRSSRSGSATTSRGWGSGLGAGARTSVSVERTAFRAR